MDLAVWQTPFLTLPPKVMEFVMFVVPTVMRNGVIDTRLSPGDVLATGDNILAGSISTVGAGIWTGAAIGTGIIRRTGPVAGYIDTTDTSTNIIAALAGNAYAMDVVPGLAFRLRLINTVAFAHTFAAGVGVLSGTGTLSCAASSIRDYIVTVLNASPAVTMQSNTTNASAVVTFVLPPNTVAFPIGTASNAINITPGMQVSGTGITAGTYVIGVTQGAGGIIGVTLSANATATSAAGGTPLTFLPSVQFDSIGSGTL